MDKKQEDLKFWIFIGSLMTIVIILSSILIYNMYKHPENNGSYLFNKWCIEQGYERGSFGAFDLYCEKEDTHTIYRAYVQQNQFEIQDMNKRYKFVKEITDG